MMDGKMVTVAHGRVHPVTKENKLHCVDLPPDMAKVDVNKVLDPFVDLDVGDRHPEPGCNKLGQCKGYVMKWPKDAIKLVGKSTHTTPHYSSDLSIPRGTHTQSPDIGGHISTNTSVLRIPAGSLHPIDAITVSMNKIVLTTIF
jgi:hypothetical protein